MTICQTHPDYTGQKEPTVLCRQCWALFFLNESRYGFLRKARRERKRGKGKQQQQKGDQ
jgi:hypothetical protein